MSNFDIGGQYGYISGWDEFVSETPYIKLDFIPKPPRLSRLSLALMVCSTTPPNPPPVRLYQPLRKSLRGSPVFLGVQPYTREDKYIDNIIKEFLKP